MSVSRAPEPPFSRLLTLDAAGLIGFGLGVAFITALAAMPGLARLWVSDHFESQARDIQITATVAAGVSPEAVLAALEEQLPIFDVRSIESDAMRQRMAQAGVAVDELDPFALEALPRGFAFRVEGLVSPTPRPRPQQPAWVVLPRLRVVFRSIEASGDTEFHWDIERVTALQSQLVSARTLLTRLHQATCWMAIFALAALALAHGPARLGLNLTRLQMVQALIVRALIVSVLGYLFAGMVIAGVAAWLGDVRFSGIWEGLMWIVPAATLLAPLGALRR